VGQHERQHDMVNMTILVQLFQHSSHKNACVKNQVP